MSEKKCLQRLTKFLEEHPCINRRDYAQLVGKTKTQALQDINSFIEQGILKKYGYGRSVVYIKGVNLHNSGESKLSNYELSYYTSTCWMGYHIDRLPLFPVFSFEKAMQMENVSVDSIFFYLQQIDKPENLSSKEQEIITFIL